MRWMWRRSAGSRVLLSALFLFALVVGVAAPTGAAVELPDKFVIAFPSPAVMSYNIIFFAPPLVDALEAQGVEIEVQKFRDYQAFTAGLLRNEFHTGPVAFPSLINSIDAGFPIQASLSHTNELLWVMLASNEIRDWEDLDGETVAYHSVGSTTNNAARAMVRESAADEASVRWSVIPGTPNRVIAVEQGRIQATTVSLESALDAEARGAGHILGSFSDFYTDQINDVIVLSPGVLGDPGLEAYVVDLLRQSVNWVREASPEELAALAMGAGVFPDYSRSIWVEAFGRLQRMGMWPEDGVVTRQASRETQRLLLEYGLIGRMIGYDELFAQ